MSTQRPILYIFLWIWIFFPIPCTRHLIPNGVLSDASGTDCPALQVLSDIEDVRPLDGSAACESRRTEERGR